METHNDTIREEAARDDKNRTKELTRKEILAITEDRLEQGWSKQQVLEDLRQHQRYHSEEYLAQIVATVPDVELRRRYTTLNRVFFGLLVFVGGLHAVGSIATLFTSRRDWDALSVALFALMMLGQAKDLWRMRANAYMVLGWLSIVVMGQAVLLRLPLWSLLSVALLGTTSALSFHLGGCLFPHRGLGGIKKDEDGKWML
jgi:hypothetical protein